MHESRQGRGTTHRCHMHNRNRLRQYKELHQVLRHKRKDKLTGQSPRQWGMQEGEGT
jgi:hypothetical protein